MRRRDFLAGLAGLTGGPPDPLRRGFEYLWRRQAPDGGWHSDTYGLLRSGQSLTPFVLDALLRAPFDPPPRGVERAIGFLRRHINGEGALGLADPMMPDYPNYATALAVKVLCRNGVGPTAPLVGYLRRQQFTEQNGWSRGRPAYGAWGMGGERRTPPDTGHVDLSITRHVLEALAAAGVRPSDPAFHRAAVFLDRCRSPDGGFHFSTVVLDANKAGHDGERYRSYGTATADGILSLRAAGVDPRDGRLEAARRWLRTHHRLDGAPGFVGEAYQRWTAGLRFYYAAAVAAAMPELAPVELPKTQRGDGSWANSENLVKEDDPLIATAFAVMALAR